MSFINMGSCTKNNVHIVQLFYKYMQAVLIELLKHFSDMIPWKIKW